MDLTARRHELFRAIVAHPVGVLMVFLGVGVFGWVSYKRLALDLMPDISYPSITVRTEVPGAAPEEVEEQISRPIEESLSTVQGLVELESRSRAELSDVILEFGWGTDIDQAAQDVRERLQTTWLPDDAERPLILRYDPSLEPILRLAISTESPEDWRAREEEEREKERRAREELAAKMKQSPLAGLLAKGALPPAAGEPEEERPLPAYHPASLVQLRELAEREIKPLLEAMDGVAAARVRGGLERQVLIEVREDWLAARGITLEQVQAALIAQNVNISGGSIREGDTEFLIRTPNQFSSVLEVQEVEIVRADGARVRLADVATVREAHKDREVISLLDGRPAVELEIHREADANIVQVARAVKERLGLTKKPPPQLPPDLPPDVRAAILGPPTIIDSLPEGVVVRVQDDQAAFIEASLSNLFGTVQLGALLAVGILFLFLRNFRATTIIALAIPVSLVVAFAPMYLGAVSLNLMSLGGLALGVGMLVDNAVVVLESIQTCLDRGMSRKEAAIEGVGEVAAAVTASTLTTVAVFFPITFVEGVAGQIFGDLAMAVVFSLLASLGVALFLVPMVAALGLPLERAPGLNGLSPTLSLPAIAEFRTAWRAGRGWRKIWRVYLVPRLLLALLLNVFTAIFMVLVGFGGRAAVWVGRRVLPRVGGLAPWAAGHFGRRYEGLARRYEGWLTGALRRPGLVLGVATAALLVSVALLPKLGVELIPEVHQGRFTAELALPVGTPLERTEQIVARAEALVEGLPEVVSTHATIGTERQADSEPDEGEHTAKLRIQLSPGGDLAAREQVAMDHVRALLLELPDTEVLLTRPALFSFETPIEVVITGQDLVQLRGLAREAQRRMAGMPDLTDLRSSLVRGFPEVRIRYDRELLAHYGLDLASVARGVRNKVQGADARELAEGERRIDMLVRLDERDRAAVEQLQRFNVNPMLTPPIPLSSVATLEEAEGPSEIRRVNQQRVAVVSAALTGFDLAGAGARIQASLARMDWPEGYSFDLAGQSREMQGSMASLRFALLLSIFLVYAIMAGTFEHLLHPLVILGTLPLAVVGVVLTLLPLGMPLSVVVLIGLIVLAGVVVNNAIVLVDAINRRRRQEGLERVEAIRVAGRIRLRPILITTSTTVLGLLPLALGFGEGSEIQRPLAITIIAGLSSSTLLTLVVIPVLYDQIVVRAERWLGRGIEDEGDPETGELPRPGQTSTLVPE
ncbi:MAG: efflux RND transporter permease subunit [Pseudomonadota bacterium]